MSGSPCFQIFLLQGVAGFSACYSVLVPSYARLASRSGRRNAVYRRVERRHQYHGEDGAEAKPYHENDDQSNPKHISP